MMRDLIVSELRDHPAEYNADDLVDVVMANGGGTAKVDPGELKVELSRMIGTSVRLNPNNTLVATL